MEGKLSGYDSSWGQGTSEELSGSLSKEQASKQQEGASPVGIWQNGIHSGKMAFVRAETLRQEQVDLVKGQQGGH